MYVCISPYNLWIKSFKTYVECLAVLCFRVAEVSVVALEWQENKVDPVLLDHEVHGDKLESQEQL